MHILIVADEIAIELVMQQIKELEKEGKSYVIEGFPRTRVQAIALQKMGIIPDKFFILTLDEALLFDKIRSNLPTSEGEPGGPRKSLTPEQVDTIAHNIVLEHKLYFYFRNL